MPETATIALQLFASTRQPIDASFKYLARIKNGNQKEVPPTGFHQGQLPLFGVKFFDNFGDHYTVNVAAKKHHDAGFFPVKVRRGETTALDLMLMPKKNRYNFDNAAWAKLKRSDPALIAFIARGVASEDDAHGLYDELLDGEDRQQDALASLHNITTALKAVELPVGKGMDYFKQLIWDKKPPQRDRFFAFTDLNLIQQIKQARAGGLWADASAALHPGATSSYKQVQFGEANIQLAFHENDVRDIGGTSCVKVEADLDYFRDDAAHFLLEVIPNALSGSRTSPKAAYVLRWIAGRHAGVPEFNPPYTIEAAAE